MTCTFFGMVLAGAYVFQTMIQFWGNEEKMSTVLTQDHFYSDRYAYKLQRSLIPLTVMMLVDCKLQDHAGLSQLDDGKFANTLSSQLTMIKFFLRLGDQEFQPFSKLGLHCCCK